jgi:2-polyprenyl-6-methoxyphenol hydroxylase-like FAD-dependent oxidoreductase
MTNDLTCDVLVVGAGPAGLSTAIGAALHGAAVLVVDRHPTTSVHPRSLGLTTRTMEVFRGWGLARRVRAASLDVVPEQVHIADLSDPVRIASALGYPSPREALAVSPVTPLCCPQDRLEPLMLDRARELGCTVRFDTTLTGFSHDDDGVRAEVIDRRDGSSTMVRARYVVGADGPRSAVRAGLGITTKHLGTLGEFVSVLFHADLTEVVGHRPHALYSLGSPDATGVLVSVGRDRWTYARQWHPDREESPHRSAEQWAEVLRAATGLPHLRPIIHDALPFTMSGDVATTYRAGRGFLAGDAAHRMTPIGAVGLNTAVQDGHNLGWKLVWSARGLGGDGLLASYDSERRPVGLRNALSTLYHHADSPPGGLAADLGVFYESDVIAHEVAPPAGPFAPSGRPGERVPHRWIDHDGRRCSTLDLLTTGFTVFTGRAGWMWEQAASRLRDSGPLHIRAGMPEELFGIEASGAVLARPDGHIAWRSRTAPADPGAALDGAITLGMGSLNPPVADPNGRRVPNRQTLGLVPH